MKIGYIIGPQGHEWQDTYYDKFLVDEFRPWLKKVPKKYFINDDGHTVNSSESQKYVRIDVAVLYCLKYLAKNIKIGIIKAENITDSTLKKYDLIINQFMDLLIVPYIKKYELNKKPHEKLRLLYEKYADRIYPPVEYTNLIYDKCKYYPFLQSLNFPIAPTLCVSKSEYNTNSKLSVELVKQFHSKKWFRVFAKPVHGTDSIDTKLIPDKGKIVKSNMKAVSNDVNEYMKHIFSHEKYPKIVFQKFMKDFEKTVPQIRMYYVGNTYQYSVLTTSDGSTYRPKSDVNSKYNIERVKVFRSLPMLKKMSANILSKIQEKYFGNIPKLITRIDYGCCLTSKRNSFFVNEIEFNPGLYLHVDGERKFNMELKVASQLLKVIKSYN